MIDMTQRQWIKIFGFILFIAGVALVSLDGSWMTVVGIFLMMWGNNTRHA